MCFVQVGDKTQILMAQETQTEVAALRRAQEISNTAQEQMLSTQEQILCALQTLVQRGQERERRTEEVPEAASSVGFQTPEPPAKKVRRQTSLLAHSFVGTAVTVAEVSLKLSEQTIGSMLKHWIKHNLFVQQPYNLLAGGVKYK